MSATNIFADLISRLTPITGLGFLLLSGIAWLGIYATYNVYLHPLRRFPGPKLWVAFRIPFAVRNIQGRLPFKVNDFHRRYGPIVRIAPDELSFIEPKAWEDIYGLQPGRRQNRKDIYAYTPVQPGQETGIIHADDETHARLRRIYGPAFTPKAVEEQSEMLMKYADLLVTQLKNAINKDPVQDLTAWYNFTTFDLTGEFAFGEAFHCLDRGGEYHFFVKTIFDGVTTGLRAQQLERYGLLTLMKPFIPKSALKPKADMDQYTKELVDGRLERGYDPKTVDVFNYLLQNKKPEDQLSKEALYENGITLVVAGSETTATLLTGATYFLSKNPAELKKVQHEVRSAFQNNGQITVKAVNDCPYLLAVLSETMRMFPPTSFGMSRIITAKEGQLIAGHFVPHNTHVAVPHLAAYRSELNFARPDKFIPGRWLPDAPAEFARDRRDVLQPFMVGPRGCIGRSLAYAEMRLLLAKMLYHFDFELADPSQDWYDGLRAFMVWEKGHLKIRLTPVKS